MISAFWLMVRQSFFVAGKELRELRRQPGVLALVVFGPFLVLAAFGLGYRNEELALRTIFVGPEEGPFEEALTNNSAAIEDYVVPLAFTTDLFAAASDLRAGRADLIIVLPPDPIANVLEGEQSEIAVIHNSIDPIEQIGIQFATELAVRELNSTVVSSSLDALLTTARAADSSGASIVPLVEELEGAARRSDDEEVSRIASQLNQQVAAVSPILEIGELRGASGSLSDTGQESGPTSVGAVADYLDGLVADPGSAQLADVEELRTQVDAIDVDLSRVLDLDANILARPFFGDSESLVREPVGAEDHVAPGATALLLQHLGVSLAALSLVRDDRRGVLTDYRVGPVGIGTVLVGKLGSLSIVAFTAGALIVAGQTELLGVPQRGSIAILAMTLGLLAVASVGLGLVLASLGRSELSASQTAMIALLSALFFSGFMLDLGLIREPFRSIGFFVPARPAVSALRSIQLRGETPVIGDFIVMISQAVVAVVLATWHISRRWRKQL